jgi:hypothetical protein
MLQAKLIMVLMAVSVLCGCAVGTLSPRTPVALDGSIKSIGTSTVIQPTTGIPRAEFGAACASSSDGSASLSGGAPLYAVRPGVGSRMTLTTWSAGWLRADLGSGNPSPPELSPITVALRLVGDGQLLDPAERAVLATFLTGSRTQWSSLSGPAQGFSVTADTRRALVANLESHQAALWNALVRSLCIEVRASAPPEVETKVPAIRVVANMAGLCAALPATSRAAFVKTFIDAQSSDSTCTGSIINRSLNGVGLQTDSASWPATVLAVTSKGGDNDYYDSDKLGSPKTVFGTIEVNTVRPFDAAAPLWSLDAWEASGICWTDGEDARIDAVLLHDGWTFLSVESEDPTYEVIDRRVTRDIQRVKGSNLFKFSIGRNALKLLTAADVRALRWRAGEREVSIPGCDKARR